MKTLPSQPFTLSLVALVFVIGLAINSTVTTQIRAESAPASAETKEPPATNVGSETCSACHEELMAPMQKTYHGKAAASTETKGRGHLCEGCHGPGSKHADDPTNETALAALKATAASGDGCLSCHATQISHVKWQGSPHKKGNTTCLACHGQKGQPHADMVRKPASDRCTQCHMKTKAEVSLPSHHPVKEGRVTCADCHDPHAATDTRIKRDVCVTCHAAQRGPYRYEHGAISGHLTDACLDCHQSHGSPNKRLLKLSNRGLCLQCHGDKAAHFTGRRCWDCHTAVHGSNANRLLFRK